MAKQPSLSQQIEAVLKTARKEGPVIAGRGLSDGESVAMLLADASPFAFGFLNKHAEEVAKYLGVTKVRVFKDVIDMAQNEEVRAAIKDGVEMDKWTSDQMTVLAGLGGKYRAIGK